MRKGRDAKLNAEIRRLVNLNRELTETTLNLSRQLGGITTTAQRLDQLRIEAERHCAEAIEGKRRAQKELASLLSDAQLLAGRTARWANRERAEAAARINATKV